MKMQILSNKTYDRLKWIAIILLPATGWAIGQFGEIWGWQDVDQIVKTIDVIGTFLGILLGVSTYQYNKQLNQQVLEEAVVEESDI